MGKPASQPATRGPCSRSTMPNTSSASGTMVSFRISKSAPRPRMVAGKCRHANAAAPQCLQGPRKPPKVCRGDRCGMTRIFLAGIFHETHSFSGDTTGLDGFVIHRGAEILARRGDASQVDGFLSVAEGEGWEVVPSVIYTGGASGTVDHAVFEQFWSEVKPVLEKALADGLDAIHLSLHGAMLTSGCDDPEGELMARIRSIPGAEKLPIYCVGDLHGTLTPKMGNLSDCMIFYRECPHTDAFDSAVLSSELLARCLKTGVRPQHF